VAKAWTRDELLLVMHLYERIPFGQQHSRNPQVIELAHSLGRTPGSVAMKLNNFTSLDPEELRRGVKGLPGTSELDRKVWSEFHASPRVVEDSEALWESRFEPQPSTRVTEAMVEQKVRLGQRYFQRLVLANFEGRCALTGLAQRELLVASHISPWSLDERNRLEAANGLCLNRLHDAAFDRKLISFDDDLRLIVSRRLTLNKGKLAEGFLAYAGQRLAKPVRREISLELLRIHREELLRSEAASLA
jgi:putative restriction endonuclease